MKNRQYRQKPVNFADGWAHGGEDDSVAGLLRELQGMLSNDKHEQLLSLFQITQVFEHARNAEKLYL